MQLIPFSTETIPSSLLGCRNITFGLDFINLKGTSVSQTFTITHIELVNIQVGPSQFAGVLAAAHRL